MKYFYYISSSKVEMLSAQTRTATFGIGSISSKLKLGIASITISAKKRNASLVTKTIALMKQLESQCAIYMPDRTGVLSTNRFYHDSGFWRSGLFCFAGWDDQPAIVYALWRELGDSLILLIGSPNNILGDKVIAGGCTVPCTSGAHEIIQRYIETFLTVDEPVAVRVAPPRHRSRIKVRHSLELSKSRIEGLPTDGAERASDGPRRMFRGSLETESDDRGLNVGMLCLEHMRDLPRSKIDVLFRIFSSNSIPSEGEISRFGRYDPASARASASALGLLKYRQIYLGSPVYTALL